MKTSINALCIVLGLAVAMPATMAVAADTATPGAAMDNAMSNDKGAADTAATPAKKHHKHHHHKAATSEDTKTNGSKHHHHHKKADAAPTDAAPAAGEPAKQ